MVNAILSIYQKIYNHSISFEVSLFHRIKFDQNVKVVLRYNINTKARNKWTVFLGKPKNMVPYMNCTHPRCSKCTVEIDIV